MEMYDGSEDLVKHVAHFETSCGDTAHDKYLLVHQFLASLSGIPFSCTTTEKDNGNSFIPTLFRNFRSSRIPVDAFRKCQYLSMLISIAGFQEFNDTYKRCRSQTRRRF